MRGSEKTLRDYRYRHEKQSPSFSSTLLDKIYRSIDQCDAENKDLRLRRETIVKKQNNVGGAKIGRSSEEEEMSRLRQACSLEKKVQEKVEFGRKSKLDRDHDALFLSSGSDSSDSSPGVMFSSDMESISGVKTTTSTFSRPKPIRTGSERTGRALLVNLLDNLDRNRETQKPNPEAFIKSKSSNSKISGNSKQPISPGGRLAAFLNSIFAARNGEKLKNPSLAGGQRISKSAQPSTCSSASSFSRSCLSKHSQSSREKLRNGVNRSVRFCTVNEDLRPREEEGSTVNSVPARKIDSGLDKLRATEKKRRLEEAARGFLRQYHRNQRSDRDQNDDDGSSCSSSDLFELDHLQVMSCDRYREELPVYETTRLDRNRVIANGLTM